MRTKRGSEKYYIIISLILGLMVLGLSLYFIFHEYFTQEDIDWETCRQSVIFRSGNLINGVKWVQENAPFKCKTQVIEIDFKDREKAEKLIANTMASCWHTYGEGEYKLYGDNWVLEDHNCFICARIHFDKKVEGYYSYALGDPKGRSLRLGQTLETYRFDGSNTVGEYIYGLEEFYSIGGEQSQVDVFFKDKLWINKIKFPTFIDSAARDIFIVFVFTKSGFYGPDLGWDANLFIYQPGAQEEGVELGCDAYETIPA